MSNIQKKRLEYLRRNFPAGTRIQLDYMNDPYTDLQSGDKGTVVSVDDIGTIHVNWDRGSMLGLVYGEDLYTVLEKTNER